MPPLLEVWMSVTALALSLSLGGVAVAAPVDAGAVELSSESGPEAVLPVDLRRRVEGIINGTDATAEDYPMTGGMMMDVTLDISGYPEYRLSLFLCSSTLIAPDVVMLAAHCLSEDALTYGQGSATFHEIVWTRQADLTDYDGSRRNVDWPEDAIVAADWVAHEDFNIFRMQMGTAENADIALLFLDTPVTDVPFAYLPTPEEGAQIAEGAPATIVGWGQQTSTGANQAPPAGTYLLKKMGESTVGEVDEFEFQVGPSEDQPRKCHGDSGGPTFMTVEAESADLMRVVGVTSHAYDSTDCRSKGGVDTRVDAYLEWINDEMTKRCEDGTRVWCETPGIIPAPLPEPEPEVADLDGDEDEGSAKGCAVSPSAAPLLGGLVGLGLLLARRRTVRG
jgi:hypothetical protein